MPRINPLLFVVVLFIAGFAAAYSIRFTPEGSRSEGRALIGGPFSLADTDGKRVTDRDFRGKLMLVFFGYTHCPDVCPTELQNMATVTGEARARCEAGRAYLHLRGPGSRYAGGAFGLRG